jgi:hypothetical protein
MIQKSESIREWHRRTTRKSRVGLAVATVISLALMTVLWFTCDLETLKFAQTFNGALTMVLLGGLWVFAFIFMFLVPSREASFRAQEALEDGIGTLKKMVENDVVPAAKAIERLALLIEKDYPEVRKRVEESLVELKETSKKVEKALEDNATFVQETRPVLQALKRIEERIEEDLLDDMKLMAEAVKRMGGMPAVPVKPAGGTPAPAVPMPGLALPSDKEPTLSVALASIQKKKKEREAASSQPK